MVAATTIAILIMLTVMIVRIAGVIMRLTGLPESIARFQALSALTGTGFTTGESEMIVNYPIRRHVLMGLMIIGHLGLVTLASTLIIAMTNAHADEESLLVQALTIIIAIAVVLVLTLFKSLDNMMCGFAEKVLLKTTKLGEGSSRTILQLDNNYGVFELPVTDNSSLEKTIEKQSENFKILGVRKSPDLRFVTLPTKDKISQGDIILCFGDEQTYKN